MANILTCTNTTCHINSWVGDYTAPLNTCPNCNLIGTAGLVSVTYSTCSFTPFTPPPPPMPPIAAPADLEAAVKEDVVQILNDMVSVFQLDVDHYRRLGTDRDISKAAAVISIMDWIKKVKIPEIEGS